MPDFNTEKPMYIQKHYLGGYPGIKMKLWAVGQSTSLLDIQTKVTSFGRTQARVQIVLGSLSTNTVRGGFDGPCILIGALKTLTEIDTAMAHWI
jgi:hypothetical protein